jgi:dTDP-4-dehydrorhamnose reductase
MRIAVTGKSGQVAQALQAHAARVGATVVPIARPDLDLADDRPCVELFGAAKPDIIVSAAAYTAVDKAESEAEVAHAINARGPERIAAAAATLGVPLIHISTDYVFDGAKPEPWIETDAASPISIYGATKLAGERAVLRTAPDCTVLRVAWVYSPYGANFVKTMMRLGETRDELRVVADQIGGPTSAFDIADGILKVAANLTSAPDHRELRGIFHMGPTGTTTWAGFAEAIFAGLARRGRTPVAVHPITTEDYPTPARRPKNSRLDSRKLEALHGVVLPDWRVSLEHVLDRLAER